MKVACLQFAPGYRTVSDNIRRIRQLVEQSNAEICILPELALTGYFFKERSEIAELAEPVDGRSATALSEIAHTTGKSLITGFLEESNGQYYNAALAFD